MYAPFVEAEFQPAPVEEFAAEVPGAQENAFGTYEEPSAAEVEIGEPPHPQEHSEMHPPAVDKDYVISSLRAYVAQQTSPPPMLWRRFRAVLPSTVAELKLLPSSLETPQQNPTYCFVLELNTVPEIPSHEYCAQLIDYIMTHWKHINANSPILQLRFVKVGLEIAQCVVTIGNANVLVAKQLVANLNEVGFQAAFAAVKPQQPCATFQLWDTRRCLNPDAQGIQAADLEKLLLTPGPNGVISSGSISIVQGFEEGVWYAALKRPDACYAWLMNPMASWMFQRELYDHLGILITMANCEHDWVQRRGHFAANLRTTSTKGAAEAGEDTPSGTESDDERDEEFRPEANEINIFGDSQTTPVASTAVVVSDETRAPGGAAAVPLKPPLARSVPSGQPPGSRPHAPPGQTSSGATLPPPPTKAADDAAVFPELVDEDDDDDDGVSSVLLGPPLGDALSHSGGPFPYLTNAPPPPLPFDFPFDVPPQSGMLGSFMAHPFPILPLMPPLFGAAPPPLMPPAFLTTMMPTVRFDALPSPFAPPTNLPPAQPQPQVQQAPPPHSGSDAHKEEALGPSEDAFDSYSPVPDIEVPVSLTSIAVTRALDRISIADPRRIAAALSEAEVYPVLMEITSSCAADSRSDPEHAEAVVELMQCLLRPLQAASPSELQNESPFRPRLLVLDHCLTDRTVSLFPLMCKLVRADLSCSTAFRDAVSRRVVTQFGKFPYRTLALALLEADASVDNPLVAPMIRDPVRWCRDVADVIRKQLFAYPHLMVPFGIHGLRTMFEQSSADQCRALTAAVREISCEGAHQLMDSAELLGRAFLVAAVHSGIVDGDWLLERFCRAPADNKYVGLLVDFACIVVYGRGDTLYSDGMLEFAGKYCAVLESVPTQQLHQPPPPGGSNALTDDEHGKLEFVHNVILRRFFAPAQEKFPLLRDAFFAHLEKLGAARGVVAQTLDTNQWPRRPPPPSSGAVGPKQTMPLPLQASKVDRSSVLGAPAPPPAPPTSNVPPPNPSLLRRPAPALLNRPVPQGNHAPSVPPQPHKPFPSSLHHQQSGEQHPPPHQQSTPVPDGGAAAPVVAFVWQDRWNEVFARYPPTGDPFPALDAPTHDDGKPRWKAATSKSYGHYYFRSDEKGSKPTYKHPHTDREYMVSPQAFVIQEAGGCRNGTVDEVNGMTIEAFCEKCRVSQHELREWLSDQRHRNRKIDEAVLRELKITYRERSSDSTAPPHHAPSTSSASAAAGTGDSHSPTPSSSAAVPDVSDILKAQRDLERKLRFVHEMKYPARGHPFPPLPKGWTCGLSSSNGLYYFRDNTAQGKHSTASYEHPVTKQQFAPTPQAYAFFHGIKEPVLLQKLGPHGVGAERIASWLADQTVRDLDIDYFVVSRANVKYDGATGRGRKRNRSRSRSK